MKMLSNKLLLIYLELPDGLLVKIQDWLQNSLHGFSVVGTYDNWTNFETIISSVQRATQKGVMGICKL